MTDTTAKANKFRERATFQRKRGDAYRKSGREEDAIKAFDAGSGLLRQAISMLKDLDGQVSSDLAGAYGERGGLLRRIGDARLEDALKAYAAGARLEADFNLPSTYNRLNAIKLRVLLGKNKLIDLQDELKELADSIDQSIRNDPDVRKSGWAYADLGDCLALLGQLGDAKDAYAAFISKGERKSPETTLAVLSELAEKMGEFGDPDADRVSGAAEWLESRLRLGG